MKKILLLEDEEVLANIYKKNLEKAGFSVKSTETVKEASEIIKDFKPDLALIDHGIRGQDEAGLDFIPELKKSHPDTKVIMLTNYSHFQIKEEAEKVGIDDFLIKLNTPPATLVERVKKLFS